MLKISECEFCILLPLPPFESAAMANSNTKVARSVTCFSSGRDPDSKDVKVFASIEQALTHLAAPAPQHDESLGRIFVIGGAQLYTDLLNLDSSLATVDKLLITRILAPHYECDAYFPEFRIKQQYTTELEHANKILAEHHATPPQQDPTSLLNQPEWTQASTDSLRQYLGNSCPTALLNSPDMVISEGETWYEYQLWEKQGAC